MNEKSKLMRYNTAPKYCTAEKNGLCIVFEKSAEIRNISNIECIFKPIKIIHYNGSNSVIEDSTDVNIQPLFLELRTGSLLPEIYDDLELMWYEQDSSLEEILTLCTI